MTFSKRTLCILITLWGLSFGFRDVILNGVKNTNQYLSDISRPVAKWWHGEFRQGEIIRHVKTKEYGIIRRYLFSDEIGTLYRVKFIVNGEQSAYDCYEFELEHLSEEEKPTMKSLLGY